MKPTVIQFPIVQVDWLDSKGVTAEWEWLDEVRPLRPNMCQSVGYLIDDQKDYKTIAQSFNDSKDNAQVVGRTTIPTCAIVQFSYLTRRYRRLRSGR